MVTDRATARPKRASRRKSGKEGALLLAPILTLALIVAGAEGLRGWRDIGQQAVRPHYKVGAPYRINGVRYRPAEDMAYRKVGIASFYGGETQGIDFHRRPTANGEIYDMHALSAAHPTLPLPSIVSVTNLENGRSIVLRVNDRGPFVGGRIIDVSRRAAEDLGFAREGTARVRVEVLEAESRALKQAMLRGESTAAAGRTSSQDGRRALEVQAGGAGVRR